MKWLRPAETNLHILIGGIHGNDNGEKAKQLPSIMHNHIFIAQWKIGNVNTIIGLIVSMVYCLCIAVCGIIFGRLFPISMYLI